jgi:predicted nucleic acid-binding protein
MTGFLVDTNVISEVLRPLPDPQVIAWSQRVSKVRLFLSVVSFQEMRKGLTIMPAGARRS